jgi:hypothetical protein
MAVSFLSPWFSSVHRHGGRIFLPWTPSWGCAVTIVDNKPFRSINFQIEEVYP